ncbi:hypothetical protein [Terrabacter sp. C0L_2]|uniref:hypothetical protein n=1 Tax=Terrabacter sp. C0L_2 TaxID=3108389 RepID=UPI002ED1AEEB|nr:hypothetical protein U5C87_22495 [Terrabacter sp. C0L_2]
MSQIAHALDHVLHFPGIDIPKLRDGCQLAVELGLAAVTCRPDHVDKAARYLDGTGLAVITALDFHRRRTGRPSEEGWAEEARRLAGRGASELAVIANAERLSEAGNGAFMRSIERLISQQDEHGYRLRVQLDAGGLTDQGVATACRAFAKRGVWMVQGGTELGARTAFRQIRLMREALGTEPLLKWTTRVSFHVMLLALGEGVDRFNADVVQLLEEARRQEGLAPLAIPLAGLDY